jgi:multiple sugar transport system substrate-binding protein
MRKRLSSWLLPMLLLLVVSAAAGADNKVVIPFWMGPPGEVATKEFWDTTISAYNRLNKVNAFVDLQYVPTDSFDSKLKTAQAAGTAPQIVYVNHATAARDGAGQGLYMPLNDFVKPSLLDDLYPNIRDMITVKGKIYSIPLFVEPYSLLFYRKDLFRAAGLDPNKPPRTFDETIAYAQKLTKGTTFGLAVAGSADNGWVNWGWEPALGLGVVSDDWSKATVNNPAARGLLAFYKTAYEKGVVPKQPLGPYWDIQPLAEGRVAMQFNGTWAISRLLVDFKGKVNPADIGIALVPTTTGLKSGDYVGALGGWGLGLDGRAANPKEAADAVVFLTLGDPKYIAKFVDTGYYAKLSVRKSVDRLLATESQNKVDAWFNLISTRVVPHSLPEPLYPWDISAFLAAAIDNVVVNGMTVNAALAQSEDEINDFIQSHKLAGKNPRGGK